MATLETAKAPFQSQSWLISEIDTCAIGCRDSPYVFLVLGGKAVVHRMCDLSCYRDN